MKSCLTWLGAILLSAVAIGDTACIGLGACFTTPFCRWFDLPKLCKESGTCSLPAGMTIFPGDMDGDKSFSGQGHFEHVWSTDSITIPLSEITDVMMDKPDLQVVIHLDEPFSPDGIKITADGQEIACRGLLPPDGANQIALDCALPGGVKEVKFEYVVTSSTGNQGNVSFDLEMFLREREGACTGSEKSCQV